MGGICVGVCVGLSAPGAEAVVVGATEGSTDVNNEHDKAALESNAMSFLFIRKPSLSRDLTKE